MAIVRSYKGYLYREYYDPVKGYTRRQSLKMKDTRRNRKTAILEVNREFVKPNPNIFIKDALEDFFIDKNLKPKTILIYKKAVDHLIDATKEKYIWQYTPSDYNLLKKYFRIPKKISIDKRKKKPEKFKNVVLTQNSQALYTRHLKALFTYFAAPERRYTEKNPIDKPIRYVEKVPRPVPSKILDDILRKLKDTDVKQYAFIYLLVNTGMRAGTILAVRWEDIDFTNDVIYFRNIKVRGTEFTFPLIPKLKTLFNLLDRKEYGQIFPYKSIDSLSFFRRVQVDLKLTDKYGIHKLKHTFISQAVDEGISLEDLSVLTNTSLRTLKKHYYKPNMRRIGERLQNINITDVA